MSRVIKVVDGERVVVRVPDPEPEDMVLADHHTGREASNPPGSFEALYQLLARDIPPIPDEGALCWRVLSV